MFKNLELYQKFILLILFDIITTFICFLIGGIEYNPISMMVLKHTFIIYALVKILLALIIYVIGKYTLSFNQKANRIILKFASFYFIIIVGLNTLFICLKIFGVI